MSDLPFQTFDDWYSENKEDLLDEWREDCEPDEANDMPAFRQWAKLRYDEARYRYYQKTRR